MRNKVYITFFLISLSLIGNLLLKDSCSYKFSNSDVVAVHDVSADFSDNGNCDDGCNCHCHHNHFSFAKFSEGFSISEIITKDFYFDSSQSLSSIILSQKKPPKLAS